MKKTLLIAALTIAAAPAFASKARLSALAGSEHLSDHQNSFTQPEQLTASGEMATFEWGTKQGTPNAEGGFVRAMGDGHIGFYLGRQSASYTKTLQTVGFTSPASDAKLNNPFDIAYSAKSGDMTWGVNFYYLNSDVKTSKVKSNIMGLALGATNGMWDAGAVVGLAGTTEFSKPATTVGPATSGSDTKLASSTNILLRGGYLMENIYYYGKYEMGGAKLDRDSSTIADLESSKITLGMVNSHKKDGTDFFYGVSYVMDNSKNKKNDATKTEETTLPVVIGVEAEAANWLVFRGSVTQNVLLGSKKVGSGDSDTTASNTTVAAGAGMKWNKFMLDGTFKNASKTGDFGLDSAGFLGEVSMTYMF